MAKGMRFTDGFKQDAVAQVVERGCGVSEVADDWVSAQSDPHSSRTKAYRYSQRITGQNTIWHDVT